MNILLISRLYPVHPDNTGDKTTRVLHNLVKYWQRTEKVIVVRPVFIYIRELLKSKTRFKKRVFEIDHVQVVELPVFKIPKVAYFYSPFCRGLNKHLKIHGFKPDIVVAHYDKSLNIGYRFARKHHLPLVAGLHITPDLMGEDPRPFNRRCRKVLDAASAIACRSNYIFKKIDRWYPAYQDKSFVALPKPSLDYFDVQIGPIRGIKATP